MNLQGRDPRLDLNSEDVRVLQSELAQIGLAVPDSERLRAFFGPGTFEAFTNFQKAHGLANTSVVDATTASAINQEVDAITYIVAGTVASPDRAGVGGQRVIVVDKNVGKDVLLSEVATGTCNVDRTSQLHKAEMRWFNWYIMQVV
jgi:peptidoglycan hydrolase-like protein with peptidoglycan-binding domain